MIKLRKFISLCIALSFLVMTYTGLILFIAPQWDVAYWMNWRFLGLSKLDYVYLHSTFMVLFIVSISTHLYLNWKPFKMYLKNQKKQFSIFTKEFILALGVTIVFIVGTLYEVPPFKTFLNFGYGVEQSWKTAKTTPPYSYAENSSLSLFCKKTFINPDKAMDILKKNGLKGISLNKSLSQIAIENSLSPATVYNMIKTQK